MSQIPQDEAPPSLSVVARLGLDWGQTTFWLLRRDTTLAIAFVVFAISALSPLFYTPMLPFVDMGSNMGASGLLWDALLQRGVVGQHYHINFAPTPYWTAYSLLGIGNLFFGPFIAHKLIVAICILLFPLGMIRLSYALGRNPRIGLLGFLLAWDINMYWGWVSFTMGMPFAFFALARLLEARDFRGVLRVIPLSILVAITHIHAVAMMGVIGILTAFTRRPLWRGLWMHALGMSGAVVFLLPWLVGRFSGKGAPPLQTALSFTFPTAGERIQNLYLCSLQVLPLRHGPLITASAFLLILLCGAAFGALPQHRAPGLNAARGFDRWQRLNFSAVLALCGVVVLYMVLPFAVSGRLEHWWTYPRFATYILAFILLAPRPRLDGWYAFALAPLVGVMLLMHHGIREQQARYGDHVRPYLEIIQGMKPNTRFLPLDYDPNDSEAPHAPVGQLHGFAAAAQKLYDGHLFDEPNNPLLFRKDRILPHPNWRNFQDFSMEKHGQYYDYIVVRGLRQDPLVKAPTGGGKRARLLKEAGTWRLYEVVPETAP